MIPPWNLSGVLPPFVGSDPKDPAGCSPYRTTTEELAQRFASTPARRLIMQGFLKYRRALVGVGVTSAFQWLDGSFIENVERMQNRNPGDIDVVTFGVVPVNPSDTRAKTKFMNDHGDLFYPKKSRDSYSCDAYFVDLTIAPNLVVDSTRYWSGLFSHRKATNLWKGMVAVDLATNDSAAWQVVTQP